MSKKLRSTKTKKYLYPIFLNIKDKTSKQLKPESHDSKFEIEALWYISVNNVAETMI